MELNLTGKTALITGAGRGLGESIALSLAREGVTVIAVSRTKSNLDQLLSKVAGDTHLSFAIDLEQEGSVNELIAFTEDSGVSPDIIVNNVGGNLGITDPLCSSADWRSVLHLNLEVAVDINRHFIPYMRDKQWGRICHVSSIAALENQGPPPYCAAKAALNAYVRSVGRYVSADGVIVTSVMPGAVLTDGGYWDEASKTRGQYVESYLRDRMAIKRLGKPEEISQLVTFLCSEHASFCAGSNVLVDGGQGRVFEQR